MTKVRKGQALPPLSREAFHEQFVASYHDPAFDAERASIGRLEVIAWTPYREGRKAPWTAKAGPAFAIRITTFRSNGEPRATG